MIWIIHIPIICFLAYTWIRYAQHFLGFKTSVVVLMIKVMVVLIAGWFNMYSVMGDSLSYLKDLVTLNQVFDASPSSYLETLYTSVTDEEVVSRLIFYHDPRPFFFLQLVSPLFLLVREYWLSCLYLGIMTLFSLAFLSKQLIRIDEKMRMPSVIALFLYPSFVFWSSGLMKEPIAISCLVLMIGIVLLYKLSLWQLITFIVLSIVLFKLKYFYAGALLPILIAYKLGKSVKPNYRLVTTLSCWCLLIIGASFMHPLLHVDQFLISIEQNYTSMARRSQDVVYAFDGTLITFLSQLPKGLFVGLFRPFPFIDKIDHVWQFLAMLENFLLCVLMVLVIMRHFIKKVQYSIKGWLSLIYVVFGLSVVSVSCSSFGTLSRYRIGFIFVLLLFFLRILDIGLFYKNVKNRLKGPNAA